MTGMLAGNGAYSTSCNGKERSCDGFVAEKAATERYRL